MNNKKIISLAALIVSVFMHGILLSVPAYLYFVKYREVGKDIINNSKNVFTIEASMLPDFKTIGNKSTIKRIVNKTNEIIKKEELGANKNNSDMTARGEEADSEMLVIYDYIKRKIQENKRYPYQAKKEHIEGIVEMQFSIDRSGLLKDINIIKSSGFKILDEEALATIKRASPYPEIPNRLNTDTLQLQVKLIYKIE